MKKAVIKIVSVLMLLSMLLCCFACVQKQGSYDTTVSTAPTEDGLQLPFGKESYGKDFTVLY